MQKYHFVTNQTTLIPGEKHVYRFTVFDGVGATAEEAAESVKERIPPGFFIMAWWEVPNNHCCP
jgi:hypothetical protein